MLHKDEMIDLFKNDSYLNSAEESCRNDSPRVERRRCCASLSPRRSALQFEGREAVLLVSTSPSLSEREISLWKAKVQFESSSY